MGKIILKYLSVLFFFLLLNFFSVSNTYAACSPKPLLSACHPSLVPCTMGIPSDPTNQYCCDSPSECLNAPSTSSPTGTGTSAPTGPCAGLENQPDFGTCKSCVTGGGAYTALGCINTDPAKFIGWLLKNIIGIAGGIAFLLILYGGFQVLTSGGDPEKLNNGKDIIVSALAGVLLILFSVLLLKIIGLDILHIPGF